MLNQPVKPSTQHILAQQRNHDWQMEDGELDTTGPSKGHNQKHSKQGGKKKNRDT